MENGNIIVKIVRVLGYVIMEELNQTVKKMNVMVLLDVNVEL